MKYLVSATSCEDNSVGGIFLGESWPHGDDCSFWRTRSRRSPFLKIFKKTGVLWFSPPIPPAGTLLDSGASREDNSDGEVFLETRSPWGFTAISRRGCCQASAAIRADKPVVAGFSGERFTLPFFVSKNLFPQYYICKIHI